MGKQNKTQDAAAEMYSTNTEPLEALAEKLEGEAPTAEAPEQTEGEAPVWETMAKLNQEVIEEQAAKIIELERLLCEREQTIADQEAVLASMMQDVEKIVKAGAVKGSDRLIEFEGTTYKLCSPTVIIGSETHTVNSLENNPALIAAILENPEQTTLIKV